MSEAPAALQRAEALIREGNRRQAADELMAVLPDLEARWHPQAYTLAGLAWYFDGRYAEALGMFHAAATGSTIPEHHFNVAMAQVKVGDIEGAHASWQRCFDLSYQYQDAPATTSFFQKKLLFAEALLDAGAADPRGLDLLARQLMGFFTHHHVTDASFWAIREVPAMEAVVPLTLAYFRALGLGAAAWQAWCDEVTPALDSEGQAYMAGMREGYDIPPGA